MSKTLDPTKSDETERHEATLQEEFGNDDPSSVGFDPMKSDENEEERTTEEAMMIAL